MIDFQVHKIYVPALIYSLLIDHIRESTLCIYNICTI